jgi:hypothetical protein
LWQLNGAAAPWTATRAERLKVVLAFATAAASRPTGENKRPRKRQQVQFLPAALRSCRIAADEPKRLKECDGGL